MDLISWKRLNSCSSFLFYFPMFVFSDIKGSLYEETRFFLSEKGILTIVKRKVYFLSLVVNTHFWAKNASERWQAGTLKKLPPSASSRNLRE